MCKANGSGGTAIEKTEITAGHINGVTGITGRTLKT